MSSFLPITRRSLLKAAAVLPAALTAHAQRRPYEANWQSIDTRPTPSWFSDGKFGIFIHWGVYSVPAYAPVRKKGETAYAEWYWHSLTEGQKRRGAKSGDGVHTVEYHDRVYGRDFSYFDFAPMFKAQLYDPDGWADLFKRSGAQYVALTSKHHEGFTLWKSAQANQAWSRPWNSVDIGPKRDLLADLMSAGRRRGLHMGIYYSLYEWYNPLWLSDKKRFVAEHLFPQFKDVVNHAKPSIIFTDGEWEIPSEEWRSTELLSWLFNESPVKNEVVVNDRWGKETRHVHGGYYTTEYTSGMQGSGHVWEESRGMGFSYGYNRNETLRDYHTQRELLLMLTDIVSRGGNLLLDIGPRADGQIPVVMEERLTQIGEWLRGNGEAIYGTRPWRNTRQWSNGKIPEMKSSRFDTPYEIGQLVDAPPAGFARVEIFFTSKGKTVYALLPRWPETGRITIKDLPLESGARFLLLESGARVEIRRDGSSVDVILPQELKARTRPSELYALKIEGVRTS
jgi:alpha-L-fucosidase